MKHNQAKKQSLITDYFSSGVAIMTSYVPEGSGSILGLARLFSSPHCPDQLWCPPSLVSSGYRRAVSPAVKRPGHEADHSHLVLRSRIVELYLHSTIYHGHNA
jgi:hypothetical protein